MNRITLLLSLLSATLSLVLNNELNNEVDNELNNELSDGVSSRNLTGSCPGMHVWCPHDQVCCKADESQYNYMCCPYSHGVCCDHKSNHCCNAGQYCTQWGCSSPLLGDPAPENGGWVLSEPQLPKVVEPLEMVVCPDKSSCKDTCCEQDKGVYGCCPVPSGACCKDQAFCCPQGYQCTDSSCIISGGDETLLIHVVVNITSPHSGKDQKEEEDLVLEKRIEKLEKVVTVLALNSSTRSRCDDGSRCHGHQTCCATGSGAFNCCPYRTGVCCSNGKTCCPPGFLCSQDSCVTDTTPVPLSNTQQRTLNLINNLADNYHLENIPDVANHEVTNQVEDVEDAWSEYPIYCGGGALCTGNKCCQIAGTELYHCCPFEGGTCCGTYCCPQPFMCGNNTDPEGQPCMPKPVKPVKPVAKPSTAQLLHVLPQDLRFQCSDDVSTCPDGQTCCIKPDGTYNCAPFPNATCCADGIHACPEDFICERDTNLCKPVAKVEHKAQLLVAVGVHDATDVTKINCDEEMECGDNQTCCLLPDTTFGCCPFPNALCCADRRHCCARGYHCHRSDHWKCLPDNITLSTIDARLDAALTQGAVDTTALPEGAVDAALVVKPFTALTKPKPLTHQCNDKYRCSNSATCCIRPDGSYGCCPYQDAVCCSDKLHCCPSNSHCDMAHQMCINDTLSNSGDTVPWATKTPAIYNVEPAAGGDAGLPDLECGLDYTCPAHTTCCLLSDGTYGCCPYNNAVCCSDGEHCCPQGYTCNIETGSCKTHKGDLSLEMRPVEVVDDYEGGELCKDGTWCQHKCCKTTGGWGCCPLKVVPQKEIELPYTVLNSMLSTRLGLVQCNHKYSCPDGATCCPIEEGEFGCCSYSNATCCQDTIHCCPEGFTCDLANEACIQGTTIQALLPKSPAITKAESLDYPTPATLTDQQLCPDNTSSCDSSDTCCEVPGGGYGCCPLKNATCCTDSWHCCPSDMKCLGIFGVCYSWNSDGRKVFRDWLTLEEISEEHITSRRNILP